MNPFDVSADQFVNMTQDQLRVMLAHMSNQLATLANDMDTECPALAQAIDAIREGKTIDTNDTNLPTRYIHFQRGELYAEVDVVKGTIKLYDDNSKLIKTLIKVNSDDVPEFTGKFDTN